MKNIICTGLVCLFALMSAQAQEKPDADKMFLKARDTAFDNHWFEARKMCRELLSYYPDYHDATILIGRTYAWELKTDSARMIVSPILEIEPDSHDVLLLLANNEIWGGNYDNGLEFIEQALVYYPSDEEFLFKRANAYFYKTDNDEAIKTLKELLAINPNHEDGKELLNLLLKPQPLIDKLYALAETETRAGNWVSARSYCRQVLENDPDHFPAKFLMAQNFAFENKFDSARIVSSKLYEEYPENYDLLELMVNIEIWNNKYKAAMTNVETALAAYPDDQNFLFKKAQIQYLSKDYKDALKTLDKLLAINPEHEDAIKLRDEILQNHRYKDYVFIEEFFDHFKHPYNFGNKLITSTGLAKWTKYGTYIGRVSAGEELPYEKLAYQYELEVYQSLFLRNSLWLDYAYSPNNDFFPLHRGGAEYFHGLPKGFEVSLGMRFLYWNEYTMFYTASVSWVKKKNYWAFRTFFSPSKSRINNTSILTYRRYFSEKPEYVYALAGYGTYSDEFLHINPNPTNSYLFQIGIHKFITNRWFFLTTAGYGREDGFRKRYSATAGIRYYFNMFK